jgi:hypothetical protein
VTPGGWGLQSGSAWFQAKDIGLLLTGLQIPQTPTLGAFVTALFFATGSLYVAQAGLELVLLLPQQGLQVCTTTSGFPYEI